MTNATEIGNAGLASWRAAVADRVAPPAAKRTRLSEDQARAIVGAAFLALATFYVVTSAIRIARAARS